MRDATRSQGSDAEQEYAVIVHQAGEPQHALASFVRLMMNYQYGLGVLVALGILAASAVLVARWVPSGRQERPVSS